MDEKEIAKRLRDIYSGELPKDEIVSLANELDPPLPEPGTVVWWKLIDSMSYQDQDWKLGVVGTNHRKVQTSDGPIQCTYIEWKRARILDENEVAVKSTIEVPDALVRKL